MRAQISVMIVFGTRPEAIKMAPVVKRLAGDPERFRVVLLVTAQHREMLDQVLRQFGLRPDYDLDIMEPEQSLTGILTRSLAGLDCILQESKPELVIVHGDTATTLAGALAGFHHGIPVAHVEAGLRSGDRLLPFPEEMYRRVVGDLAEIHFAPTCGAAANLRAEGVEGDRVFVTGNTAIDALLMTVDPQHRFANTTARQLAGRSNLVLVEVHRRENWGPGVEAACRALHELSKARPEIEVVFSIHRNPRIKRVVEERLGDMSRCHLLPPLSYPDWVNMMARARLVVTDSGGLQEEAPALGVPVLLLRDRTERPEALKSGGVTMVGTDSRLIVDLACRLLDDVDLRKRLSGEPSPFGDGRAAERIHEYLLHRCHWADLPPAEFAVGKED